jgi:hypothetical protein
MVHVSSRTDPHYKEDTALQLEWLNRCLKNYLFKSRRKNFRISDTILDMRGLSGSWTLCM